MPVSLGSFGRIDRASAILDVASQRLNARGVSEEWFGDIASELGITRPALYSHFDDRDELLFACYMRTVEALETAWTKVGDARDAIAMIDAFLGSTISEDLPELAVVAELDVLSPTKRDIVATRWSDLINRIGRAAADAANRGALRPLHPTVVAQAVLGLATWAPLQRRLLPDRPTSAVLSGAREILFRGLARDRSAVPTPAQDVQGEKSSELDLFDRASVATAKREKLLGVASGLFNRRGVGATRVEEIAEAVGFNKRAIFRQFGSKDQLVAACFERANAINQRIADDAAESPGPRVHALYDAVRKVALSLGDPVVPSLTSHVGLGRLAPGAQARMRERFATLEGAYRDMLSEGIADGSIREIPINDVVAALAGILNWIAGSGSPPDPGLIGPFATEIADLAVFGVAP